MSEYLRPNNDILLKSWFNTGMSHYVYILECTSHRFYTGYTTDLERRYQEHVAGSPKCKFTRSFPPLNIAACWEFPSRSEALKVEYQIKKMSKREKLVLIQNYR